MQLTLLKGYPDYIGKRMALCGYGPGLLLYTTGGDTVTFARYGNYIDILFPALSVSGTYAIWPIPSGVGGRQTWKAVWKVAATGIEVAANVNLSAEQVQLGGYGGVY